MLPTATRNRRVRTDALAKMQDTGAISQAATPDAPKAPTLGRSYRPAPIAGKVQGALPAAPQAPQRMAFGGQPQPQAPMAPRTDVLAGLAAGLKGAKPPGRVTGGDVYGTASGDDGTAGGSMNVTGPGARSDLTEEEKQKRHDDAVAWDAERRAADEGVRTDLGGSEDSKEMQEKADADKAQADRDALDQQIRDFVSGRVAGANEVDTTEQEALIRELVEGKTGAALVDQRARGGRAGFAASGAQQAIEGDIRKQAGQAASGDILDLRRTEQQRAFDNATQAINTESGMRSAASDDALRRMFLESLQAEAGLETGAGGSAGGSAGDAINSGVDGIVSAVGGETEKPSTATAGGGRQTVSAPPAGFTLYQTLSNGDQLWKSPNDPGDNSTVVIVKAAT